MLQHSRHLLPLVLEHRLTELTFFTTDVCNMKCRHCFVTDALNNRSPRLEPSELSRMSPHIGAAQRVHLGGGEPFTRPDIGEIATIVSNEWRAGVVCIPTNGWFTNRILAGMRHFGEQADGHLRLQFSINSPDPERMDAFTQLPGTFERWRRSIDQALELSKSYPNITVLALATYNEHNQHEFAELIDWLHQEVGIEDFSFQLARTHDGYGPELDIAGFRAVTDYYFKTYNRQHPVLAAFRQETRLRSADYFAEPAFATTCKSGKIRVVMSPGGDIYPCEKLGYPNLKTMAEWKLGNIRDFDYDVNAVIRSERGREIYRRIRCEHCHCDHNIDQSLSLLSTAGFRNKVLKRAIGRATAASA